MDCNDLQSIDVNNLSIHLSPIRAPGFSLHETFIQSSKRSQSMDSGITSDFDQFNDIAGLHNKSFSKSNNKSAAVPTISTISKSIDSICLHKKLAKGIGLPRDVEGIDCNQSLPVINGYALDTSPCQLKSINEDAPFKEDVCSAKVDHKRSSSLNQVSLAATPADSKNTIKVGSTSSDSTTCASLGKVESLADEISKRTKQQSGNILKSNTGSSQSSWLLRLFESKLFDMSIAIQYLFNSKEPGVQSYIGNRMFSFEDHVVDFYLPQLVTMYIYMHDIAEVLHPYLVYRCRRSIGFSLNVAWLLGAYSPEVSKPNWKNSQGPKLRNMILAEELRPSQKDNPLSVHCRPQESLPSKKVHQRSWSDASCLFATSMKRSQSSLSVKSHIGDLSSGRAFHNGCTCAKDKPSGKPLGQDGGLADVVRGGWLDDCRCGAPRLQPQLEFVTSLMTIGKKLSQLPTKEAKTSHLMAELNLLNLNLPSRVCLPINECYDHHVIRIPQVGS